LKVARVDGKQSAMGLHGSWNMNRLTIAICNVSAKPGAFIAWATAAGLHHRRVVFILNLRDSRAESHVTTGASNSRISTVPISWTLPKQYSVLHRRS
jgi:hypothetical protein